MFLLRFTRSPAQVAQAYDRRRQRHEQRLRKRLGMDRAPTDEELRAHMRPRARRFWVPGAVVLVLLAQITQSVLLVMAALLVLSLGIVPEIWYWLALRGMQFRRVLSATRVRPGEALFITYQIENHKILPVPWLEVEDELAVEVAMPNAPTHPSYKPGRQLFISSFSLWGNQRVSRRYRLVPEARGVWRFGPTFLRAGDPFGFLERDIRVMPQNGSQLLTVLPIVAPLTRMGLPAHNPFGDLAAQQRLIEDPSQIIGTRDYQPGDPLRRVHWKATARSHTLQSKVYPFTTTHTLAIFLDIHTSANPAQGFVTALFELGIAATASIASWGNAHQYAVGLFSNGLPISGGGVDVASYEEVRAFMRLPPSAHPRQLPHVLDALARLQPYFGFAMERLIAREEHQLPLGATIVVISAAAALHPQTVAQLERLRRRGANVALLLTGEEPAQTGSLLSYRLGGKEAWHDLVTFALGGNADGANPSGPHDDAGTRRHDAGRNAPTHGAPAEHRHEPAFRVG
jgi:uncharacterized protein (DUF58 family)